jgi:hypothetical protein
MDRRVALSLMKVSRVTLNAFLGFVDFGRVAVQTLRSRFNECYEKADFAKSRTQDIIPEPAVFAEKLIFDKALEMVSPWQKL